MFDYVKVVIISEIVTGYVKKNIETIVAMEMRVYVHRGSPAEHLARACG